MSLSFDQGIGAVAEIETVSILILQGIAGKLVAREWSSTLRHCYKRHNNHR